MDIIDKHISRMADRNTKKKKIKNTVIKFPVSFLLPQWLHYKYRLLAELGQPRDQEAK